MPCGQSAAPVWVSQKRSFTMIAFFKRAFDAYINAVGRHPYPQTWLY